MATQTPEITITVEARENRGTGEAGRMRTREGCRRCSTVETSPRSLSR